jgi:phosphonopyruvate decarboxylase
MISPKYFIDTLASIDIDFFTGIPDSLLKNICSYLTDNSKSENNIIAANEGAAMGLAAGYHLATGKIPVVYMQNSGLGNIVNPLMSLTDEDVYNIPVLLLIGWRGEPGQKDEPQHVKQGKVTIPLLDTMGIKNIIMSKEEIELKCQFDEAVTYMKDTSNSYAFVIRKDTFHEYKMRNIKSCLALSLCREEAIKQIINKIESKAIIVSTTGMISRELFEIREIQEDGHERDFLTVGSMGHASQIALGIALQHPQHSVYCFDGDGAAIMHLGSLGIIGSMGPENLIHIILNNGAHDSVGGQSTVGFEINFSKIAEACGYKTILSADDKESLSQSLDLLKNASKPILLEIKVKKGARKNLGRPTTTPIQNKKALMKFLKNEQK